MSGASGDLPQVPNHVLRAGRGHKIICDLFLRVGLHKFLLLVLTKRSAASRGDNSVRFKGLGMLYGNLPDDGIPVPKDEKGDFRRGRGKGFKVGMGRRGSIIDESRFDDDGNFINPEGGGGHGFLGDAEGLISRTGSAEGGMFDGGEGLLSRPGSSAVVDAGGGESQMGWELDGIDSTLSGVDGAASNTLETPVTGAAPVVGKIVVDPDAHRVETSHRYQSI